MKGALILAEAVISRRGIESGSYLVRFEVVIILDAAKRFSVHLRSRYDFIFLVRLILAGYIASAVAVFHLSLLFSFARLVFLSFLPSSLMFSPHHSSVRSVLRTTWTMSMYRRSASGHSPHISMSNVRRILTRLP